MENCKKLPQLTLNLNDDKNEVFKLLELIKPTWKNEQVKITVLSGGYSCHMLRCSHDSGESITVRVRNNADGLRNPEHERQIVNTMSSKGYFPPLLAIFENGFCYDYIPGRPVYVKGSQEISLSEDQLSLIAREMANIHSVVVPGFDYNRTSLFEFNVNLLSDAKPCFEGCPSIEELKQEIQLVEELVSVVKSPLLHIHGDAHPANMVWDEEKRKITFVDWELSQVGPRAYDIAHFLNAFGYFGQLMNIPVTKPTDLERNFCVHYLNRWNELSNKPSPTEDEIEQLLLELKHFLFVVDALFMVFVVRFKDTLSNFGNIESVWKVNLKRYLTAKEELFGIKSLGRPTVTSDPPESN